MLKRSRRIRFAVIASVLLAQTGCLRFFPARSTSGDNVGGEAEFYAIERSERDQLKSLITERAHLLRPDAASSYRVGSGDLIEVKVFDVPELSATTRVRPDGMITVPLIGDIAAIGKTEGELQQEITVRLKRFVTSPSVTIAINSFEGSRVSVIGEVAKPGVYPLKQGTTSLVQILSEAGGRTARAAGHILLLPTFSMGQPGGVQDGATVGSRPSIEIEVDEVLGTSSGKDPLYVPLVAGDTIVVPEAGTVEVDGEVMKPGSYALSSKESMVGAIAAAGGLTYSADVENVEVIREVGNGRKAVLAFNLQDVALKDAKDVRLRNGDVVRVPSASGRFATRQAMEFLNRIFNVNIVPRNLP